MGQGNNINLDVSVIHSYRTFCNKIWQATRYVLGSIQQLSLGTKFVLSGNESTIDRWILSRLARTVKLVNQGFEEYSPFTSTQAIYHFWMDEFCPVYIESTKPLFQGNARFPLFHSDQAAPSLKQAQDASKQVIYFCLETFLKLVHPFMPFVSEELYHHLERRPEDDCPSLMISSYPVASDFESFVCPQAEGFIETFNAAVSSARSLKNTYGIKPKERPVVYIGVAPGSESDEQSLLMRDRLVAAGSVFADLARCQSPAKLQNSEIPKGSFPGVLPNNCVLYLSVLGLVDTAKQIKKLEKDLAKAKKRLVGVEKKLANPKFTNNAPHAAIEKAKQSKVDITSEISTLESNIINWKSIQEASQ